MELKATLAALAAYGTPRRKPSRRTPTTPRERIQAVILEQLKRLSLADPNSTWIRKQPSGSYVICARNGVVPLCIGGDDNYEIECPNVEAATGYLTALLEYAKSGALDERLEATARGKKGGV